ncbi:hypothetical protein [Streptomyces sp.]|uniref:hypothetical protein n=1 Tax=Streptomyces sp. TaxID=1931 RepID=UPI002F3EFEA1
MAHPTGPPASDPAGSGPVAPLLGDAAPLVQRQVADGAAVVLPTPPRVRAVTAPVAAADGAPVAVRPVEVQRLTGPDGAADGPVVGLVGERGLELRSAPTPRQADAGAVPVEPPVVPVVWVPPTAGAASVQRFAEPSSVGAGASVRRFAAAPPPAAAPVRPFLPALGAPAAAVQRYASPPAVPGPVGGTPFPPSLQRYDAAGSAPSDPGSVAVAAGIAQRAPDGSVVFAAPAPPPAPAPESAAPPTVQREADATPAPEPAPAPVPATAPPPSPAPAPPQGHPENTDELVRRLIAPLSRLLRAELRLDRERAGLRLDSRH